MTGFLSQPVDCATAAPSRWLFSPSVDLATFGGSALLALGLLAAGWKFGWLENDTPEWTWVAAVLLVDVAHVWATAFRVYFVPHELRRRPWLYGLTPLLGWLLGACLYSQSESAFWRCLAYLAVFHFVRQQAGWVALYRAKANPDRAAPVAPSCRPVAATCRAAADFQADNPAGTDPRKQGSPVRWRKWDKWLDDAAIYSATLWPLVWWHGHLPRSFWWFREYDFAATSALIAAATEPAYWVLLVAYTARSAYRGIVERDWNPGKDLVVFSTAACWYVGIVALNSDFAFTVTNVLIHGIPYIVLVQWFRDRSEETIPGPSRRWLRWSSYLGVIWGLAYVEELFWDRAVSHERAWLFGSAWSWDASRVWLVPLLAVPQLTHYVLDGFLWKRRSNPPVAEFTGPSSAIPTIQ